jgi:hypothetical protein
MQALWDNKRGNNSEFEIHATVIQGIDTARLPNIKQLKTLIKSNKSR